MSKNFMTLSRADFCGGNMWTGLINPNSTNCNNAACSNQLMWTSDGSAFVKNSNKYNIDIEDGHQCIRMKHTNQDGWRAVGEWCGHIKYYACEFGCDKGNADLQHQIRMCFISYFPISVVYPKLICMDKPTNVLNADNDYTGNDELWAVGSNVT